MLAACEPEPKGPVQVQIPESMRFDTERIRREVDQYKTSPSAASKRKMEQAFQTFDEKVKFIEADLHAQAEPERMVMERQIADLKHRRELHWARSQVLAEDTEPIRRAEPVAERTTKAERVVTQRSRRPERTRAPVTRRIERRAEPLNLFQRLFR